MRIQLFLLFLVISCVAFAQPPSIANGGVLNGASFATGQQITAGSLVTIFGSNLASAMAQADSIPLSSNLGGVTVQWANGNTTVNAPLVFVAGTQVNAQVPWELVPPGATQNVSVTVNANGVTSPPAQVTVGPFSPGIFTAGPPTFYAIAQNVDGTLVQAAGSIPGLTTHPAKAVAWFERSTIANIALTLPNAASSSRSRSSTSRPPPISSRLDTMPASPPPIMRTSHE